MIPSKSSSPLSIPTSGFQARNSSGFTTSVRLSALIKPEFDEKENTHYWTEGDRNAKRTILEAEHVSELPQEFMEDLLHVHDKDLGDNVVDDPEPGYGSGKLKDETELYKDLQDEAVVLEKEKEGSYGKQKSLLSDEKDAHRDLNLHLTSEDVAKLPFNEYKKLLSKYNLTNSQLSIIRSIRRRGRNRAYSRASRKRKMDHIRELAEEVQRMRGQKMTLARDQENLIGRRNQIREKYFQLHGTVFRALRDPEGNPYDPHIWSLEQAADGNMILVATTDHTPSGNGTSGSIDSSTWLLGKP